MDMMIMSLFTDIHIYEVKVQLARPTPYAQAVEDTFAIEHVTRAEGLLEVPLTLSYRHLSEGTVITGMERNSALYKIADTNTRQTFPPPTDGLILTNALADNLNVGAGDVVTISSPLLADDVSIAVSRVVEQNLGFGAFMEINALSALLGIPKTATAVILDTNDLEYLKEYLKGARNAASLEDKDGTLQKYRDMMAMYSNIFIILQVMCAAVAFAIIYNTATISLSERKREYATLRVLGMTVNEVCEIMDFEYWVLSAAAMTMGVPFALFLNNGVNSMMDTDQFSMPSSLPSDAYIVAVAGCVAAVLLSNYSAKRRIMKFDMVEVLKERD
jgi:putative ABC transport system permease protein